MSRIGEFIVTWPSKDMMGLFIDIDISLRIIEEFVLDQFRLYHKYLERKSRQVKVRTQTFAKTRICQFLNKITFYFF